MSAVFKGNLIRHCLRGVAGCLKKSVPQCSVCHAGHQNLSTTAGESLLQVSVDSQTGIGVMKLSKPPVNSLNLEYLTEFNIAIEKLENDKSCRGVIITSALPKIFSAGLDILEMYQPNTDRLRQFWTQVQQLWINLYGSQVATVAAINGHAPAGGCLVSLSCDYRIMAPNYTIGLNETQLGIVAPFWFSDTITNTIGFRKAERALQLGYMFTTDEAKACGLIDKIVPPDQIMAVAHEEMKKMFAVPDFARQITKNQCRKQFIDKLHAKRDADTDNFVNFITKDSIQKAMGKYLESLKKRKSG